MFDWIKRWLNGETAAPPPGVEVERDALGRITQAKQTLQAATPDPSLPAVTPSPVLDERLTKASQWLCAQNVGLAKRFGLGQEIQWGYDQGNGVLVLTFGGGRELELTGQIVGSFDPGAGSFMWGWHNPSIRPEWLVPSETILADDEGNELMLTTPVMALKFESITRLVALATQRAGKDGVYRGITPDHTSVFIAVTLPDALDPLPFDSAQGELALEHARAYDTESFGIDRSFHERSAGLEPVESIDLMEELLLEKKAIFDRFWAKNDEWAPASFSWPSDHDLSCSVHRFAGPARDGGCIVVKILGRSRRLVYRLEETDDGARIVDQLIEWGDGFVWPA